MKRFGNVRKVEIEVKFSYGNPASDQLQLEQIIKCIQNEKKCVKELCFYSLRSGDIII